ncbi:hypothetical protein [Streptomyces pseudovenezuelae]
MTTDPMLRLILALVIAAFVGYVAYIHPKIIPALAVGVAVFVAAAGLLKL